MQDLEAAIGVAGGDARLQFGDGERTVLAVEHARIVHEDYVALHRVREDGLDFSGEALRIAREIGGGGMSRVFVADEPDLARQVVVKVLPPELGAAVSAERFRRGQAT